MSKNKIPKTEFEQRIARARAEMVKNDLDLLLVYGDEYRREHLRYLSNFWPLFERGILVVGKRGEPILLCAPEAEMVAREMSVWQDIRLLPGLAGIYVPEEIEYPLAHYTSFADLAKEILAKQGIKRVGVAAMDSMSCYLLNDIERHFGVEPIACNDLLRTLKMCKSPAELGCLRRAAGMADEGFKAIHQMGDRLIGMTERAAAALGEAAARKAGAEQVVFTIFCSGARTHTIIGRPQQKTIEDGDMIMACIAVMYEGYIATSGAPFAVGRASEETRQVIRVLAQAAGVAKQHIVPGKPMKTVVLAVREVYRQQGLTEYDVYPPIHGIGTAEAESPYPNEETEEVFQPGMAVNTDISLFGLPGGSNRVEEGFIVTESGHESLTPYVRQYLECSF